MNPMVFLHIDRTGGMSVRELLARQFPADQIQPVPHHPQATWQTEAYPTVPIDLVEANQRFAYQGQALVMGHYDWDIVNQMPPQTQVVTVLRDPVERAASLWQFICREGAMLGVVSTRAQKLGFDAWVRLHPNVYANQMTAQLTGMRWSHSAPMNANLLVLAIQHLRRCALVGLTDQLEEFMKALNHMVTESVWGWYPLPHVNPGVPMRVAADTADFIRQTSCYDVELYEIVRWKYAPQT